MALRTCCQKRLVINKIKPHVCIIFKFAQKENIFVYVQGGNVCGSKGDKWISWP